MKGELTIKGDVRALRLGPEDILVVEITQPGQVSRETFGEFQTLLHAKLEELGIPKERTLLISGFKVRPLKKEATT